MHTSQIRAFVTASEAGTFTAAASELRMSQPAVSDLVRRLEDDLGTPLFVRGARRLTLTAAGAGLRPHAERALDAMRSGEAAVRELRGLTGGTASFGLLRNADLYLRDELVRRFHARHPSVRMRLVGQNSAETAAAVAKGDLEAGLITLPVDGQDSLAVLPLVRDEILVVHARQSPEPPEQLAIDDLCERRLVLYDASYATTDPMRRQLSDRAHMAGRRVSPLIEVELLTSALDLVVAGLGDTLAPAGAVESLVSPRGLHTSRLADPMYDTVALARRHGSPLSTATTEFALAAHKALLATSRLPTSTVEIVHQPSEVAHFLH